MNIAREEDSIVVGNDPQPQPSNIAMRFQDGSALVGPPEEQMLFQKPEMHHNSNLALYLSDSELSQIGNTLKEAIEEDIESQQPYFEGVAKLLRLMGLDPNEMSDAELPFKGASAVYSTALFESVQEVSALVSAEIFKINNMVDTVIFGEPTPYTEDVAKRKKDFFNYYFDVEAKEFRKEAKRSVIWAASAGSAYKKVYVCPVLQRPVSNFIPIEDFIVNRTHSSHLAATRKTHILKLSEQEFDTRVMAGIYRDIHVFKNDDGNDEEDVIREELENIAGVDGDRYSALDGKYEIYECHVNFHIKGDPENYGKKLPLPYIISLDVQTAKILSIYRNWKQSDPTRTAREYFVNYSFLTSFDGEGYGFLNFASSLAEAATSIKRQLINSGIYSNFPGGVYQSGLRLENNNLRPAPAEWQPVQMAGQSIKDCFMALPYGEPSQALHSLNQEIEESIRKPSALVAQKLSEAASSRASEGTITAIFESMHRIPNAVLQNFYEAFTRELELFDDRFAEWFSPDQPYPFEVSGGNSIIMKSDFDLNIKVLPSSDPSTKNSAHRLMISETILNKVMQSPKIDMFNLEFAYKYFFQNVGVSEDDIKQLIPPPQEQPPPQPADPITMIMDITTGKPVVAAVWQDHAAYISILDIWMAQNPQSPNLAAAQALKQQYEAFKYMVDTYSQLGMNPPQDPSQLTPEDQNSLAVAVAHLKMQEQQALMQQSQPPEPPLDPARVELEAAHLQAQMAHEKHQIELKRIDVESHKIDMEYTLKSKEFELKTIIEQLKQKIEQEKSEVEFFKISHEQALKERDQAIKERDFMIKERDSMHEHLFSDGHHESVSPHG